MSVEVLALGGDHRLGGADWDEKLSTTCWTRP